MQTPSRLFFVIEFVRGGDLMFHMQRQRRLPEEHARFYSAEICLALNFLHDKGASSYYVFPGKGRGGCCMVTEAAFLNASQHLQSMLP